MSIFAVAALALCGFTANASAHEKDRLQQVLERGKLIVGTGSTNAPWHFKDAEGNLVGFDVDMARLVAKGLFDEPDKIEYVLQSGDGRVFLGRRLHFWGTAYLANFDLAREAQPYLEKIARDTRETSQLCMLEGDKYTVVLMKEGSRPFRISTNVGEPIPIPWTASGRLLTAHMPDEEIQSFIPAADFTLPNGTTLKPSAFIAETRKAQKEGFFSFDSVADNYTHCFAAPVYDEMGICIATLCLIAPKEEALRNYTQYQRILVRSASELSAKLSGNSLEIPRVVGG